MQFVYRATGASGRRQPPPTSNTRLDDFSTRSAVNQRRQTRRLRTEQDVDRCRCAKRQRTGPPSDYVQFVTKRTRRVAIMCRENFSNFQLHISWIRACRQQSTSHRNQAERQSTASTEERIMKFTSGKWTQRQTCTTSAIELASLDESDKNALITATFMSSLQPLTKHVNNVEEYIYNK